jgi:hypothetical protein
MNNENLEFLQESLKYLGFGEKQYLSKQLTEQVALAQKSFELDFEAFYDADHKLELTLYFRKSDQLDMYFFNKYVARLRSGDDPELDRAQTFYISKGSGVTLKESFNLLLGRAVNKNLYNVEGQKYNAWIQLDFSEKDQYNNYKVKQYREQYGYDLEKTLEKYPIRELCDTELRADLIRSLKKGNQHAVSFDKVTKTEKMFIEANPQFKTINIYSLATRGGRREPLKEEPPATQTQVNTASTRPGRKEDKEWKEEEKEKELEMSGSKQTPKKKTHK